jgi:phosphoglycerate dehydrogenase-like enzyme
MIDARALALMKPMAILINTARGAVVDIDSLAAALREGRLAGAGIDVLPGEPPQPDTPLIRLWQANDSPLNLIITPHTAFVSNEGMIEMREKAAREIRRALRDERLLNCVNTEYLKKRS